MRLQNRNGQNGPLFEQASTNGANGVIDFAFSPDYASTSKIRTIRTESRSGGVMFSGGASEIQFCSTYGTFNCFAAVSEGSFYMKVPLYMSPGSAPSSPAEGTIYYDATAHALKCWNGTAWKTISMA
jgi:hypothetical protein